MAHRCCQDFSRTELLRKAAANAGRGIPDADPRMPAPAGTGLKRRSFLLRSAGVVLSVYGASRLDLAAFEEGIARAAAGPAQPILVSVFLNGGIDSLSLLAPVGDPRYRQLRPTLALGEAEGTAFTEDPRLRWHPSAAALATLHSEGKLTVMPGIGYDHPDQSHFNSRHFWEVGALDRQLRTGWMGRYLERGGTKDNPLQGLSFDGRLAGAIATAAVPVATVSGRGTFDYGAPGVVREVDDWMHETLGSISGANAASKDPALRQAASTATQAATLRRQLLPFRGDKIVPPVVYPGQDAGIFPQSMAALAAMLGAGLPLRCVAMSQGGYDTHDEQPEDLARDLKAAADTLLAFQRDIEARGLADRVLVHVWSEFGRRGEENASKGTDHGAAGVGFLMGTRAKGTMLGEFPGLDRLDEDGNLRPTSDFRAVYSSMIEQWLSHDAAAVIPDAARYGRPALLK
jgi:uncharacterized protein (DUF1501 family)